jgi:hypothetical protein
MGENTGRASSAEPSFAALTKKAERGHRPRSEEPRAGGADAQYSGRID